MKLRTMPLLRALLIVGSLARADPSTGRGPATTDPVLLNRLVVALLDAERYQEALLLAEQALRIRESTLGPNDIHVAESLEGVASALDGLDQYAQAVPLHERAVSILEANLGPRDPIVATALNNLAETFREMGRYERAVPMHERALRIREARLGRNDPDVANSLSNLALTLREMGQYERAAPLYERALRIQEATLGANDPELATTECNLAALFYAMGQLERSIALYSSALRIRETSLGGNHPDVAHSLSGLALPLWRLGQHDRAIPLVERALRIREAALGPHHRDVALSLNNLATLFVETGRFESAIPLLERALRIREAALGPDHPDVAQTLNNLAMALAATGRYQPAIPLLERALRVQEGSLGPTHPDIPDVLNNLAIAFRATGRSERVVALQERALRIDAQRIQGIAAHQRDEGLQQFLAGLRGSADALVSFAAERPGDLSARQLALQGTLLFKARDEEEAIAVLNVLRRSATPADRTLLSEWSSLQQRVANLGSGGTPHGAAGRLESQLQAVEERLSRRSSALQERRGLADIDGLLPRLARHLDADAAMVELVGFRPLDALGHRMSERWGAEHYAAFVLHPDGSHAMVDLGEAGPLNELAQQLTALVSDAHRTPEAIARAGQALEQRLFAPIAPLLRPGTHRLLLAPDGPLHLAPLHLMHDGRRWLLDRYTVSYVTSGRDLLRERSPLDTPGEPVALAVTRYTDPSWNLPGLTTQADLLPRLVPGIRVLRDEAATEAALRNVSAPRVLHIAAHGQFLGEAAGTAMQRGRLVMADALPSLATHGGDDGLATAAELLTTNLRGTRLVVLSACETARGSTDAGQGVFGLRRAFLLAGTEALVTTQWNVDERAGAVFTIALYEGLRAGMRSADAVARAMRLVRERDPDPFAWAPFVLVGRDDAIDWDATPLQQPASPTATHDHATTAVRTSESLAPGERIQHAHVP